MQTSETPRRLAARLMQNGREDELLAAFDAHAAVWSRDPYLLLQRGVALVRFDRLGAARKSFEAALALPSCDTGQRAFAERWLGWLRDEWATVDKARGALGRARLGFTVGLAGMLATTAVAWWYMRRRSVRSESENVEDPADPVAQ